MAEYIEREAAYEKCGWYNIVNGKSVCAVRKDELAAIPAADVVEVVRCRECKWQHTLDCPMNYEVATYNEYDGHDTYLESNACNDDGFCWCGEREDGE